MPTPGRSSRLGAVALTSVGELVVEAGAVGVDVEHTATEGVHRQLGRIHHGVTIRVRSQRRSVTGEGDDGDTTEAFPQLIGGAEAEMAELVETLRARVTPGAISDHQHPDRLDVAVASLGHRRGAAAERCSSRLDGVDAVGLAVRPSGLTIRTPDLDHDHLHRPQCTGRGRRRTRRCPRHRPGRACRTKQASHAARRTRPWSSETTRHRAPRRCCQAPRRHECRGECQPRQ